MSNSRKVAQSRPQQQQSAPSRGVSNTSSTAQSNQPKAPTRKVVGQYMLGASIGEGTFGKVKLAVHLPTGEKVAVKILEKSRIKEQADVRRVNREIKILKRCNHKNVIQLYEVLDTQNSIYLIMENCEGGEMFEYIVKHRHVPEVSTLVLSEDAHLLLAYNYLLLTLSCSITCSALNTHSSSSSCSTRVWARLRWCMPRQLRPLTMQ